MRTITTRLVAAVFFTMVFLAAVPAHAQSLQDELSDELAFAFDKIISLAEEVPADKYPWRPAQGIRSFGEAFVHVAAAGYFFTNMGGVAMPDGVNPQTAEQQVTDKEDIVEYIRTAKDHAVAGMAGLSDEQLERQVDWFDGSKRSTRRLMVTLAEHTSEHLGQLIAYSRMNDVAPPWSE